MDPDQTAPLGAVWSGPTLFACMQNGLKSLQEYSADVIKQTTFSDAGFLGIWRVNAKKYQNWTARKKKGLRSTVWSGSFLTADALYRILPQHMDSDYPGLNWLFLPATKPILTCATSEYSDQPAHPGSPIRVFADRMCLLQPPDYLKRGITRTLAILGRCTGWSESLLATRLIAGGSYIFSRCGSYNIYFP